MMTDSIGRALVDEQNLERHFKRQMGCMAGFLQLFDRHQILIGKRLYSTRRLSSSPMTLSNSPLERSESSSTISLVKVCNPSPSPEPCSSSSECHDPLVLVPPRPSLPLPFPVFDSKDGVKSSWKLREAPRLSLDSRVDSKGKLRLREIRMEVHASPGNQSNASDPGESETQLRSPSVVARLMGLEALPDTGCSGGETYKAELQRSASESRVSRDPSYYGIVDMSSFEKPAPPESKPIPAEEFFRLANAAESRALDTKKLESAPRHAFLPPLQRKSFFPVEDFFPEAKRSGSLYGEIEKRLRMRGIDEPAKDLDTLKQILEALQLKGLLHSKPSDHIDGRPNLIYGYHGCIPGESPIVVMRPASKPHRRPVSEPSPLPSRSGTPRNAASKESVRPFRRDRSIDRNSGKCNERRNLRPNSSERPSSLSRHKPCNSSDSHKSPQSPRRASTVNGTPKYCPKRCDPDSPAVLSPRNRRPIQDNSPRERLYSTAEDDSSTTITENRISSLSQLDLESVEMQKSRLEDCRTGRILLERCDKLLHSIAAFTGAEHVTVADQQPSPVSVLDSSSLLGDDSSPSSAMKRSINFKDQALEWEEQSIASMPSVGSNEPGQAEDEDYAYVAEILRACGVLRGEVSDVYGVLEKRRYVYDASKAARLHRRLVFDTVAEILDRKHHVSPWESFARSRSLSFSAGVAGCSSPPLLTQVWAEVLRIREEVDADDLDGITCGAIRKDMAGDHLNEWAVPAAEISDAVLYIERQIFKDLVADAIRDFSATAKSRHILPRRKLVF